MSAPGVSSAAVGGYRSPSLALEGAVPPPDALDVLGITRNDRGVPYHYGDPLREQRALVPGGAGAVDLSHRPVIEVSGPDRLSWLHSITSQHVEHLAEGESALNLVLSPNGHVEHELHLVEHQGRVLMSVEPGTEADLIAYLESMRFMLRVEVADVSTDWAPVWEPVRERALELPTWLTPERDADGIEDRHFSGREVFVPRAGLVVYLEGHPRVGTWAWNAARVAAGVPRLLAETDHRTIPHELGWIGSAVHLNKGCYRGQETVARVHNLGKPPRRLVLLHLDGSAAALPVHGDPVDADGRAVGFVGTCVQHHELGPLALALVKRAVPTDAVLTVAGNPATQEVVVAP